MGSTPPNRNAIAFRCDDSTALRLERLRDTFAESGWRPALVWLLNQPAVIDVIEQRLQDSRA